MDESGDQFVAYFLPSDETLTKRKRDVEENVDYVDEEEWVTSLNFVKQKNLLLLYCQKSKHAVKDCCVTYC